MDVWSTFDEQRARWETDQEESRRASRRDDFTIALVAFGVVNAAEWFSWPAAPGGVPWTAIALSFVSVVILSALWRRVVLVGPAAGIGSAYGTTTPAPTSEPLRKSSSARPASSSG